MKRFFFLAAALLFLLPPFPAAAEEASASAREYVFTAEDADLSPSWSAVLDALPEEERKELGSLASLPFSADDPGTAEDAAAALREETDFRRLWEKLARALRDAAAALLPSALPLFTSVLLSAAARHAVPSGDGSGSDAMGDALGRVLRLYQATAVFSLAAHALGLAKAALSAICRVMELMVPVMEGTALFGGALTEKTVAAAGMALAATLVNEVSACVLVPVVGLLLGLTAAESACGMFGGLAEALKKLLLRLWQAVTLVVSFMLGAQTVITRAADSLGARAAKLALSSFIPVAGNAVSEAFSALRSGAVLLKSAAGVGGMLALLLLLIPALVPLGLIRLIFAFARFAADALGLKESAHMLGGAEGAAEFLSGFTLYAGILFFLALAAFVSGR